MTQSKVIPLPDGGSLTINVGPDGVAEFNSEKAPPVPFRLNGDTYFFTATLPGGAMKLIGEIFKAAPEEQMSRMTELLDMTLLEESRKRFALKLLDPDDPISINQLADVFVYILNESTGERPTNPVSPSQSGQNTGGQNLTGTAYPVESVQTSFPLNVSPTTSTT